MFKRFRRTHKSLLDGLPLARRFLGRWRLDFFLFYCPHFKKKKKMQKPRGPPCAAPPQPPPPPPTPPQLHLPLLFTAPPNDTCAVCNYLNNYRRDNGGKPTEGGGLRQGADSIIASAHQGGRGVDKKEALLLPRRPRGGSLFMYPACYVIDRARLICAFGRLGGELHLASFY